jgi:hypothetical protein
MLVPNRLLPNRELGNGIPVTALSKLGGSERKLRVPASGQGFMKPLHWIVQVAFGCHHHQRSSVFTIKKRTYQVCLKCGQEFDYSWALMHSIRPSVAVRPLVPLCDVAPTEVRSI